MNKKNIFTFVAATLTLAACQNEDMPQTGTETEAQFTTNLEQRVQSRMIDDRWESNDQIGIFTLNDEQQDAILPDESRPESNLRLNMRYYTDEEGIVWKSDDPFYFKNPASPTVRFTAYYPWVENGRIRDMYVDGERINGFIDFDAYDQTRDGQRNFDFLYAGKDTPSDEGFQTPQGSKNSPNVHFQFTHSMTKMVIKLKPDPEGSTTYRDVENLTPTLKSFISTGVFDLADGTVYAYDFEDENAVKDLTLENKLYGNGESMSYIAILPPQTTQTDIKAPEIALSDGGENNYRSAKILEGRELAAGKCYTVTIIVKKMALVIESSNITDWEPGDEEQGEAILQ